MQGLEFLNQRIIRCRTCPRLVEYRESVARKKVKRFAGWDYWGKPLPGFGDPQAKLLIIGLAPAAHGGNRTGRMFTGDDSGRWLMKALHQAGFSNQPAWERMNDGLQLKSAYITAAVRCAPPQNRPTKMEINNCSPYLERELRILKEIRVVLTLGRVAFKAYLEHAKIPKKPTFKHASLHRLGDGLPVLVASYHPSRQNTQTKRLSWDMWIDVFRKIKRLI